MITLFLLNIGLKIVSKTRKFGIVALPGHKCQTVSFIGHKDFHVLFYHDLDPGMPLFCISLCLIFLRFLLFVCLFLSLIFFSSLFSFYFLFIYLGTMRAPNHI